jgi:DNA-binding transcriptional regulator YiaG
MTPQQFKEARQSLSLTQSQLGDILDVNKRTIRKWETLEGPNARQPHPTACRVMQWILDGLLSLDSIRE